MSCVRILILDEQALFRRSFAALLRFSEKLEVVGEAQDLQQALHLLEQMEIDEVLSSTSLPDRNAFHAVRLLRSKFPKVQVAFLDSYPVKMHSRQATQAGALGYFTRCDEFEQLEAGLIQIAIGTAVSSYEADSSVLEELSTAPLGEPSDSQLRALTARELEVLQHLAQGLSVRQSAERLNLAHSTVDNHKSRLMRKLNVHKAVELTRIAIREGLLQA